MLESSEMSKKLGFAVEKIQAKVLKKGCRVNKMQRKRKTGDK